MYVWVDDPSMPIGSVKGVADDHDDDNDYGATRPLPSFVCVALTLAQDPHGAEAHRVAQGHLVDQPLRFQDLLIESGGSGAGSGGVLCGRLDTDDIQCAPTIPIPGPTSSLLPLSRLKLPAKSRWHPPLLLAMAASHPLLEPAPPQPGASRALCRCCVYCTWRRV